MDTPKLQVRGYRFGVFEVETATQELRKRGLRLKLAGQPFQILLLLLERQGDVVSREQLRRTIWPDEEWGDHDQRLNKAMNKVREALGDSADTPRYIETIPRLGYRFLFPVEPQVEAQPVPPPSKVEDLLVPAPGSTRVGGISARWKWWVGAAAGISILVSGALLWRSRTPTVAVENTLVSRPLTTFVGAEHSPSFSPDGKEIVFAWTGETGSNEDLYILETEAGGARRLTGGEGRDVAPAFSPDGRHLAFRREGGGKSAIWVWNFAKKRESKLADVEGSSGLGHLAWTPDSQWILTAAQSSAGNLAIFALSINNGERHQLTQAPANSLGDRSAVVSPSGRQIAFTRHTAPEWREVFMADFDAAAIRCRGEVKQVTRRKLRIDQLAWADGGKELWFSGATPSGGVSYLSRVIAATGEVRDVTGVRIEGNTFAISPDGKSIALSRRNTESTSLRRIDLGGWTRHSKPGALIASHPLLSSTAPDYSPDIAPDGRQVVMSSSRNGTPQLWIFEAKQTAPKQLTFLGNAGASVPRWSPDGRWVAFDSRPEGQSDVFLIEVGTGKLRRLTQTSIQETRPNWSRDGLHIYYGSPVDGRVELFKIPLSEGPAVRVTGNGGTFAIESPDGKWLYISGSEPSWEIRRRPLAGGAEETVVRGALGRAAFAVGRSGLFYLSVPDSRGVTTLHHFDGKSSVAIAQTANPVHNAISLSPDENWLIFTELLRPESDLHLLSRQP